MDLDRDGNSTIKYCKPLLKCCLSLETSTFPGNDHVIMGQVLLLHDLMGGDRKTLGCDYDGIF